MFIFTSCSFIINININWSIYKINEIINYVFTQYLKNISGFHDILLLSIRIKYKTLTLCIYYDFTNV